MSFTYRDGKRESLSLLIGLAGGTGSGKTYSAMRLAAGMSNGKKFAVVDTENGRANFYADSFNFAHGNLAAPFRPNSYVEAIQAYDRAGFPVILVDSASHEYAGEGGILEWHDELQDEFVERSLKAGDNRPAWQIAESQNMRAWIEPKMEHKKMMSRLLQVKAHVILCFRAEPKTEIAKENGKTVIREKKGMMGINGWFPIVEKNMPFEMTTYLLLMAERPGVPLPITLREPHKPFFPEGKPITEESGRLLAEWARGSASVKPEPPKVETQQQQPQPQPSALLAKIQNAHDLAELAVLVTESKKAPEADKEALRAAYVLRKSQLKEA